MQRSRPCRHGCKSREQASATTTNAATHVIDICMTVKPDHILGGKAGQTRVLSSVAARLLPQTRRPDVHSRCVEGSPDRRAPKRWQPQHAVVLHVGHAVGIRSDPKPRTGNVDMPRSSGGSVRNITSRQPKLDMLWFFLDLLYLSRLKATLQHVWRRSIVPIGRDEVGTTFFVNIRTGVLLRVNCKKGALRQPLVFDSARLTSWATVNKNPESVRRDEATNHSGPKPRTLMNCDRLCQRWKTHQSKRIKQEQEPRTREEQERSERAVSKLCNKESLETRLLACPEAREKAVTREI